MAHEKRTYEKRLRAQREAETARRITESAVHLHGTLGPSRTSISAVARLAGVRRATVYRHFPDETALFRACTAHWTAANPPPDLSVWAAIDDPSARLRRALTDMYGFYGRIEQMMTSVVRDEPTMPIVQQMIEGFRAYIARARDAVMVGLRPQRGGRRKLEAAVGHALAFETWRSLTREQQLPLSAAVDVMRRLIDALATPAPRGRSRPHGWS